MINSNVDKIWANFKQMFIDTDQDFYDTHATVDELGFCSAEAIVAQIVYQIREDMTPYHKSYPFVPPIAPPKNPNQRTHANSQGIAKSTYNNRVMTTTLRSKMVANMRSTKLRIQGNNQ